MTSGMRKTSSRARLVMALAALCCGTPYACAIAQLDATIFDPEIIPPDNGTAPCIGSETAKRIVKLYISSKFFSNLAANGDICKTRKNTLCITTAKLNAQGDDEQATQNDEQPWKLSAYNNSASENWHTPIDIDVSDSSLWAPLPDGTTPKSLILKVILEDPSWKFIFRKGKSMSLSVDAVKQGKEGLGMFDCRTVATQDTSNKMSSSIKLRILNKGIKDGGLNIGVLIPVGAPVPDKQLYMPIYIDPKVHNGG